MSGLYSITEQFVTWLKANDYAASTYPPKTGNEFVTVERTGGGVVDMVDRPAVALQTGAKTETRAEEMANEIRELLLLGALPYGVHSVSVDSGPYPFYDEDTRLPRYQLALNCAAYLTD